MARPYGDDHAIAGFVIIGIIPEMMQITTTMPMMVMMIRMTMMATSIAAMTNRVMSVCQHDSPTTWQSGSLTVCRSASLLVCQPNNMSICQPNRLRDTHHVSLIARQLGRLGVWQSDRSANMTTWQSRSLATCQPGKLVAWQSGSLTVCQSASLTARQPCGLAR